MKSAVSDEVLRRVTLLGQASLNGSERDALVEVSPSGFHLRPPQIPHELVEEVTSEDDLFQTIHMGSAVVDQDKWQLTIDGLVDQPISISWHQLMNLPKTSITAFHECYGSPIKPPDTNLWRIGNVEWTGVSLALLLDIVKPTSEARYVWSDGLEHGSFFDARDVDRYQKDVTLEKARSSECLVAYEMNGKPLSKNRGGPVRLVIPGWYGTNSTKWLCRLSLQSERAQGPFTTIYYNEIDPTRDGLMKRPCWEVEPNSFLLTTPSSEGRLTGPEITVSGRAWSSATIRDLSINIWLDNAWSEKVKIELIPRVEFEWQSFSTTITLEPGTYKLMSRATDQNGAQQPLAGRRNHVHIVEIHVV